jgi:hypothetical protein
MINFIDNNLIVYSLCTISGLIITGFYIKYYFYSTPVINTSYSPPTFNISLDDLKEIEIQSQQEANDKLDQLLQEVFDNDGYIDQDKLNQVLKNILGDEDYEHYQAELQDADNDFSQIIQDIFDSFDLF